MRSRKRGYVYIMSNLHRTTFYIGVTSDLVKRALSHRVGEGSVFTSRYNLKFLVYYEELPGIYDAIKREKQLKNWRREWKLELIRQMNPEFNDLWHEVSNSEML